MPLSFADSTYHNFIFQTFANRIIVTTRPLDKIQFTGMKSVRHDTQHNNIWHNDISHKGLACDTHHKTHCIECHNVECCYAECRYAECHYAECRYAMCHYAECHYDECRHAECRCA
jgi:hypothetical protein